MPRLSAVLAAVLLLACSSAVERDAAERPPNFLVLLVDDLGWTDLGCYGSDFYLTPNIDQLAEDGVRFTHGYAACTVCSPTRAALMTGLYPGRTNVTDWIPGHGRPREPLRPPDWTMRLEHRYTTLAEALGAAGDRTAHVGKWHLMPRLDPEVMADYAPQHHGFEINIAGNEYGAPGSYYHPYERDNRKMYPLPEGGSEGDYLTDRLTDEAIAILDEFADEPFLLYFPYYTVHTPIEGKPAIVERYRQRIREGMLHRNPHYAAMVHALDENVGRVLDALDDLGVADNTLVILTSDNGGYINKFDGMQVTDNTPLRSGKGSLYEGGIRVPAIVRWPDVTRPGAESDVPISSIDYYRTILSAAGLPGDREYNRTVDGIDLTPLLEDPGHAPDRAALYFHYPHYYATTSPVSALRLGRWKLLRYYEDSRTELYDLADDLGERRNLAGEKPQITTALTERLEAWWERMGAQHPSPRLADR